MSGPLDVLLKPAQEKEDSKDHDVFLYHELSEPTMKLRMIKQRDRFASFTATSNYEKEFDNIMIKILQENKDPKMINSVFIINPTFKSLSIYKMLNNFIYIRETGIANQWSGFNVQYQQRIKTLDLKVFFQYLWYEQLLGSSKLCGGKLEKYVEGILSDLRCTGTCDESMISQIIDHVKSRYNTELKSKLSYGIDSFIAKHDLKDQLQRFLEWQMVLGFVPFISQKETDSSTLKTLKKEGIQFSMETMKSLLTIYNSVPPLSEVAVILNGNNIDCWHLPSETKLEFMGQCNLRIENKEISFGSKGESLYYAELKLVHLSEKHFTDQCSRRYVLTETTKPDKKMQSSIVNSEAIEKNPLFATLTKAQTSLTDETNPLSSYSQIRDKANHVREYLSRINSDMNELEYKMSIFLDKLSPSNSDTFVDDMVQRGMEQYLKKLKPEIEEYERTIRDNLDKFRMYVVKQLHFLPKGVYELQEQISEFNVENDMDLDDFIEEISSTKQSKLYKVPNISSLQDIDNTALNLKQMQKQVTQYCELAVKFMNYLKNAQTVILNLKTEDSVKDLQIKTLSEHKKEIVQLALKYRESANKQVELYKEKLTEVKNELKKYLAYQDKYMSKTKQTFLSIRDSLITNTGEWVNKEKQKQQKLADRLNFLEDNFSKQHDSTCNHLDMPSAFDIEYIQVHGTIKRDNLDRKIDDNTLTMYMQSLKQYWKQVLNNIISIEETVTKNGVQLFNINEKELFQSFISTFLRIIYDRDFFLVSLKDLSDYTHIYGMDIAVEIIVRRLLKCNEKVLTTTVIKQKERFAEQESENRGLLFEK